jgi:hypothetical protein
MKSNHDKWKLVGIVSLGEENRSMQAIIKGQYWFSRRCYTHTR